MHSKHLKRSREKSKAKCKGKQTVEGREAGASLSMKGESARACQGEGLWEIVSKANT